MSLWKPLGLIASGRMADSLLLRRPALLRHLGPVAAADARLSSRYVNRLRAGRPAPVSDLHDCGLIVVHGGGGLPDRLLPLLLSAAPWRGAHFVLLHQALDSSALEPLRQAGASVCSAAAAPAPARDWIVLEGDRAASRRARAWLEEARLRCLDLAPGAKPLFLLGIGAPDAPLVALLEAALRMLKSAGLAAREARAILRFVADGAIRQFAARSRRPRPDLRAAPAAGHAGAALQRLEQDDPRLARFYEAILAAVAGLSADGPPPEKPESRVLRFPARISQL